jgi:hypothetical protein
LAILFRLERKNLSIKSDPSSKRPASFARNIAARFRSKPQIRTNCALAYYTGIHRLVV